jgi:hypothetical protein
MQEILQNKFNAPDDDRVGSNMSCETGHIKLKKKYCFKNLN